MITYNVSLSNQRINARENQTIGAPQDVVRQNNDARENQAIVAPQGTVNAMDRSRDSIAISTQVYQLNGDIVFRQR